MSYEYHIKPRYALIKLDLRKNSFGNRTRELRPACARNTTRKNSFGNRTRELRPACARNTTRAPDSVSEGYDAIRAHKMMRMRHAGSWLMPKRRGFTVDVHRAGSAFRRARAGPRCSHEQAPRARRRVVTRRTSDIITLSPCRITSHARRRYRT